MPDPALRAGDPVVDPAVSGGRLESGGTVGADMAGGVSRSVEQASVSARAVPTERGPAPADGSAVADGPATGGRSPRVSSDGPAVSPSGQGGREGTATADTASSSTEHHGPAATDSSITSATNDLPSTELPVVRDVGGGLAVRKIDDSVFLPFGNGKTQILPRGSEVVHDQATGEPVVYRQIKASNGPRLPQPRTFVRTGDIWTETREPVPSAVYESWLAAANGDHVTAGALGDIAARSGPGVPEGQRLVNLDKTALQELLHRGTVEDQRAAVYELVRRDGTDLRWTQMSAAEAFARGEMVNMAAGEGKSWLFLVHAMRQSLRGGVDAVHVITTRGHLADREFARYQEFLTPLGFDVHRMDPDVRLPEPVKGRPTIYVGHSEDVGFTHLKQERVPGQGSRASSRSMPVLTRSTRGWSTRMVSMSSATCSWVTRRRRRSTESIGAHDVVSDLAGGRLTEADFGRRPGQDGGPAVLTEAGRVKLEDWLKQSDSQRALSEPDLVAVNMAAAARWEYVKGRHYEVFDGKVVIIDQITHAVLRDPKTGSESRWNGVVGRGEGTGLAQAVERANDLEVRSDPDQSHTTNTRQLYGTDVYDQVIGASGTAAGKEQHFEAIGLPGKKITNIPRYYDSQLEMAPDKVSRDLPTKLDVIAKDVKDMWSGGTGRPQLILAHLNDLVKPISERLTAAEVKHVAVDALSFLKWGTTEVEEFEKIVAEAGAKGAVLVINMQGGRGMDLVLSDAAKAAGGLQVRVTARSELSDVDIQAWNRAARSGDKGGAITYTSPDDEAYRLSPNENVQMAVIRYKNAVAAHDAELTEETQAELTRAEDGLRDQVPVIQSDAAGRLLARHIYTPIQSNAPPPTTTVPLASPPPQPQLERPPPQPPRPQQQQPQQSPGQQPPQQSPQQSLGSAGAQRPPVLVSREIPVGRDGTSLGVGGTRELAASAAAIAAEAVALHQNGQQLAITITANGANPASSNPTGADPTDAGYQRAVTIRDALTPQLHKELTRLQAAHNPGLPPLTADQLTVTLSHGSDGPPATITASAYAPGAGPDAVMLQALGVRGSHVAQLYQLLSAAAAPVSFAGLAGSVGEQSGTTVFPQDLRAQLDTLVDAGLVTRHEHQDPSTDTYYLTTSHDTPSSLVAGQDPPTADRTGAVSTWVPSDTTSEGLLREVALPIREWRRRGTFSCMPVGSCCVRVTTAGS